MKQETRNSTEPRTSNWIMTGRPGSTIVHTIRRVDEATQEDDAPGFHRLILGWSLFYFLLALVPLESSMAVGLAARNRDICPPEPS